MESKFLIGVADFPSWVFNAETNAWEPPTPMPNDGQNYSWDEGLQSWVVME